MLRKIALLSTLVLCACEPYASPSPNIVSIEPQEVLSGETVTLTLDAPLPVKVDYGHGTATLLTPTLLIGGQEVTLIRVEQDGTLQARVPGSLPAGQQEVRLEMGDGSESISEQGLTVLPQPPDITPRSVDGGPADPNADPSEVRPLLVTGVHIDPIPDQVRGVPFSITLRAEGPEAALFEGQVLLSTSKGRISPNLSHPFLKGVRHEQVVIDEKQGGHVVLTVRAGKTIVAQSNPFKVSLK